jgi:hypothetical protein
MIHTAPAAPCITAMTTTCVHWFAGADQYGWRPLGVRYSLGDAIHNAQRDGPPSFWAWRAAGLPRPPSCFPWLRPLSLWWEQPLLSDVAL